MSIPVDPGHTFRAAEPDPKPLGWVWWKDRQCRATCSCGWRADVNSADAATASSRWWNEHRAGVEA